MEAQSIFADHISGRLYGDHCLPEFISNVSERFVLETKELRQYLTLPTDRRVLIVAPDPNEADLLEELIDGVCSDSKVDWVWDTQSALDFIIKFGPSDSHNTYDLLICCSNIDDKNSGLKVIEHCLKHSPNTKTALLTSLNDNEVKKRCSKFYKNTVFLNRPLNFTQFEKKIGPILHDLGESNQIEVNFGD